MANVQYFCRDHSRRGYPAAFGLLAMGEITDALFLDDVFAYLKKEVKERKRQFEIGDHYMGHSGICTVKEIGDDKIKHKLFRLEEDDISPIWTGEIPLSDIEGRYAVSEEEYNEVMHRYNKLLMWLRDRFCECIIAQ